MRRNWNFIERSDATSHGILSNGEPFWETEIQGYNDDVHFNDMTDLIVIRTVISESRVKTYTKYLFPDLKNDPYFDQMIKESIADLIDEANSW